MSPSPRPNSGKVAGFVLLGVAAIALVIGLVTALSGPSAEEAGGPVSGTTAPGKPGSPGGQSNGGQGNGGQSTGPSGSRGGQQPGGPGARQTQPTSYPRGSTTRVVPPPPAVGGGRSGGQGGAAAGGGSRIAATHSQPVRVYNNSTIKGLAHQAAGDFRGSGFKVTQVGNYSQGVISASTAYYRPGTPEQATAKALAQEFGIRAEARFPGIQQSSPGVIVIITNNYSPEPQK
jgi:hypothetical protein